MLNHVVVKARRHSLGLHNPINNLRCIVPNPFDHVLVNPSSILIRCAGWVHQRAVSLAERCIVARTSGTMSIRVSILQVGFQPFTSPALPCLGAVMMTIRQPHYLE